ncbi:MAG: type IV pilus twitching motility protein PilT [Gammaproteobacteria bacterium]|nr:type IV pilus twitching motility protein PilT [Gammaproteobacteria bacterium]
MDISELLSFTVKHNASDLHLSSGQVPMVRIDGEMNRINAQPLSESELRALINSVMTDVQRSLFEEKLELDFSFQLPDVARFRVNVFHTSRGSAAVFRHIPHQIQTLDELGCPKVFIDAIQSINGLVLVTGPTGSGKSTTLAAMVDYISENSNKHIVTIEDPIEFVHTSKKSLINQREVNRDTLSFSTALRSALREDPDVIMVGELRDLETIRMALTAAETGHLVLATLHTNSAAKTIDRIIGVFPSNEKDMIRSMLSESLRAVISQTLVKRMDAEGRIAAYEILVATSAVRNLVREEKIAQIYSVMQTGFEQGMHTMDQSLLRLVEKNIISREAARARALHKDMFN